MSMEKRVQYSVQYSAASREDGKYIPHADPQWAPDGTSPAALADCHYSVVVLLLFYACFFRLFLVSSWSQLS